MTLKEFAEKYKVPYHIVYESSYMVQPVGTMQRDRDFPEDDLFDAVDKILNKRMKRHTALLRTAQGAFINLHSTRRLEELK